MRYYSATVQCSNQDGRRIRNTNAPLFEELDRAFWVGLQRIDGQPLRREEDCNLSLGIAITDPERTVEDAINAAMREWGVARYNVSSVKPTTMVETLFNGEGMIPNRREMAEVAHALNLRELVALHRYPELFFEDLATELDLPTAQAIAANSTYGEQLQDELERIFTSERNEEARTSGVPVHYLLREETAKPLSEAVRALTSALYSAGRVATPHVYHFDLNYVDRTLDNRFPSIDRREVTVTSMNASLAASVRGGTVVVHYGQHDNGSEYSTHQYQAVSNLLQSLYVEPTVQVVVVVPVGRGSVEKRLRTSFARPFLAFEPVAAPSLRHDPEATVLWLKDRAREAGLEPDDRLTDLVEQHRDNLAFTEPQQLFEQWRQETLIKDAYPQYADVELPSVAATEESNAWERLDRLTGLEEAKRVIHETIRKHRMRPHFLAKGIELPPASLHAAFLGAPGTGKTEVARLYAEILRAEGVVEEGRVFEVSGARNPNFAELFSQAKGSVIFIDEAYGLIGSGNVTELIAQMENNRADTVVILAGYKDEMEALMRTNPGFRSRIGVVVNFEDYSPEELLDIFKGFARNSGLLLDDATVPPIFNHLTRAGRPDDQGNARYVRDLFEKTMGNLLLRIESQYPDPAACSPEELRTILPEDVPGFQNADTPERSAREELASMIGLEAVKKQVEKTVALAAAQKARRDAGRPTMPISMHMAFKGNPGTGKTEVARLMARILREEGILSVGDLIECSRQDLVAQYVGQTAPRVHSLFRRARGSVLFIDEAYTLLDNSNGGFGQEAVDTIVKDMEDYRDDVVVIFAGYPKPIEKLLTANPGLESRVKNHIDFPDYSTDELIQVLERMAAANQLELDPGVVPKVEGIIDNARGSEGFGNARFVRQLLESALENQALRELDGASQCLVADDFEPVAASAPQARPIGFQFH